MTIQLWCQMACRVIILVMSTDEFTKLFKYMTKRFDKIDRALEEKANKVDLERALNILDSMIKRQETCDQERLVMGHQLERVERWSHELAGKIGHKLSA